MTLVMPSGTWRWEWKTFIKPARRATQQGRKVVREPGPMKHGGIGYRIIEDPNGYKVELIDVSRRGQA
jgi:hypothetical protein